jgi:hypothetical protein
LFMLMGLPLLVLAAWPRAIGWLGEVLHIEYTTVSLLIVVVLGVLMVLEFLTIVSLQDRKIAALAQIVGILMEKHGMNDHDTVPGARAIAPGRPAPTSPPEQTVDQTPPWDGAPPRRNPGNMASDLAGNMAYDVAGPQNRE